MNLKDILERVDPRERKKIFALWAQCATAEEIKQSSLASGVPVSDEEAAFLLELKTRGVKRSRELQDDELDNVAGGCGKKEKKPENPYAEMTSTDLFYTQEFFEALLDNESYDRFLTYY